MEKPVVTSLETKEELLLKSKRKTKEVPIRNTFVQKGTRARPEPGPLATFVRNHDELGLDLYLLMLAVATHEPYALIQPAPTLARALGPKRVTVPTISKAWTRLETMKLIKRGPRSGRLANVIALREDGSGDVYTHPGAVGGREPYFKLNFAYWQDGLDESLTLPAKAMLLIALSLKDWFYLPYEKAKAWYGISAETAETGLRELEKKTVIERQKKYKKAPLAPLGYTEDRLYRLRPPFGSRRKVEDIAAAIAALGGESLAN
ncbi:MAG: hypothetical protein M3077_05795 [Candidatus Dormibacteraeota bacterium]|nr:hypothetical protein [Candidatus Dormibacteraeota bacterium]